MHWQKGSLKGELSISGRSFSPVFERLVAMRLREEDSETLYAHTVFSQVSLPYRDEPGLKVYERHNGNVHLRLEAGRSFNPVSGAQEEMGLPFGQQSRLLLFHLNAQALRQRSPLITLEKTPTAFLKKLGLHPNGRNIQGLQEQLGRLAATRFILGFVHDGKTACVDSPIVDIDSTLVACGQSVWPKSLKFADAYFETLRHHAVPLKGSVIAGLAHSCLCIDIYAWLTRRLPLVTATNDFVPWKSLRQQFGPNYGRMRDFKRGFFRALQQVGMLYPAACGLGLSYRGMRLFRSAPRVPPRRRAVIGN